ncbi:predicted protein [Chaetoceros tenuissimus]|uniref:MYND-type domain-containing protein n=1 Tax=Chaetoceros tenuissimus TaxID=426638 RepID=A0AAD3H2Q9_9STRA|nr:predicted protein [Chaetoceros tenuissimus]
MLRLNCQECNLSDFVNVISQEISDPEKKEPSSIVFYDAVDTLRVHKQFESAIRLEKTFGSLLRSPSNSKVFLAMSYFEQYRVEFSRMRKEDFLNISHFMDSLMSEYPFKSHVSPEYCLLLAEYYYLTQNLVYGERAKEESVTKALTLLKLFLTGLDKVKQVCCFSCAQVATPTEVKFVCSGCRIASYCSIDHQRATWKKEALAGRRIGHEILCPLYNAYRKYTRAKDLKDEVKESRMIRRLDRECVMFLADGLGLKNKCFPCEYQK